MNRRGAQCLLFSVACGLANAALSQGVTYDFTGLVGLTGGEPSTVLEGATVTGTYTFNYLAAIPSQSDGTPGSGSWESVALGGTVYGVPPPAARVFSSTAHVGGVSYSTAPISAYYTYSGISGYPAGNYGFGGSTFTAAEDQSLGPEGSQGFTQSYISFTTTGGLGYSSKGLPLGFGAANPNGEYLQGEFAANNGFVDYTVTVLKQVGGISTAVPESDTTTMLMGGLALLGFAMATRRRNSLGWKPRQPSRHVRPRDSS